MKLCPHRKREGAQRKRKREREGEREREEHRKRGREEPSPYKYELRAGTFTQIVGSAQSGTCKMFPKQSLL